MWRSIKEYLGELNQYSEASRELALADSVLSMFWGLHFRGFNGTEYNKAGFEMSVKIQLKGMPKTIDGIDVGWEKPILRDRSSGEGKVFSFGDLEEFAKNKAKELGRYRPIWYEQTEDGKLVRHRVDVFGNEYVDKRGN